MQKILVHSTSQDMAFSIKSFLEKRLPYEVYLSKHIEETEELISSRTMNLLIFETQTVTSDDLNKIKDLRQLGYVYPVLILGNALGIEEFFKIRDRYRVHYLEKPFEWKALRGIARKLLVAKTVPQQLHRRYKTNQEMMIETFITGEKLNSSMFNLSMGGAYCEFSDRPNLGIGDLVRMKVGLSDVERSYVMNARIVWTTRRGSYSGGHGVGVKFVKKTDIYKHLMEKL